MLRLHTTLCKIDIHSKRGRDTHIANPLILFLLLLTGCTFPQSDKSNPDPISIPITIITPTTQGSPSDSSLYHANLQRTGEYDTKGVPSLDGLLWSYEADKTIWSPPVLAGDLVYFLTSDGYLHALDASSGIHTWKTQSRKATPLIADGILYYSWKGNLYAVDSNTKQEKWRFLTDGDIEGSPAVFHNTVYFGSGDGYFYALDTATGQLKWKVKAGSRVTTDPAIGEGTIYLGGDSIVWTSQDSGLYEGTIYALDLINGQEKWTFKPDGSVYSPIIVDGSVYCVSLNSGARSADVAGYVYELDARTGRELWSYKPAGGASTPPAVANGVLYIGSDQGVLYAIDVKTKGELWKFSAAKWIAAISVANGVVYFSSGDSNLYALDAKTGTEKWKFATKEIVRTPAIVSNDTIYFADDHHVYAVR